MQSGSNVIGVVSPPRADLLSTLTPLKGFDANVYGNGNGNGLPTRDDMYDIHKDEITHIDGFELSEIAWRKWNALQQYCIIQEERQRLVITLEQNRMLRVIIAEESKERRMFMTSHTPEQQQQQLEPLPRFPYNDSPPQAAPTVKANGSSRSSSGASTGYTPDTRSARINEEPMTEREFEALHASTERDARELEARSAQLATFIRRSSVGLLETPRKTSTSTPSDILTQPMALQSAEAKQQRWSERKEGLKRQESWWLTVRRLHDLQENRARLDREYMALSRHIRHLHEEMQQLPTAAAPRITHIPSLVPHNGRGVSSELMGDNTEQEERERATPTVVAMISSLYKRMREIFIDFSSIPLLSKEEFTSYMHVLVQQEQQVLRCVKLTPWFIVGSIKRALDACTMMVMTMMHSVPLTHMALSNTVYLLMGLFLQCYAAALRSTVLLFYVGIGTSSLLGSVGTSAVVYAFHTGYDFAKAATTAAIDAFVMFPLGCIVELINTADSVTYRIMAVSRQAAAYSIYLTVGVGAAAAGNMKQTVTKTITDVKQISSVAAQRTMTVSGQIAAYNLYFAVGVGAAVAGNVKRVVIIALTGMDAAASALLLRTMKRTLTLALPIVENFASTAVGNMKRAINGVFSDMKQISSTAAQRTISVSRQAAAYSIYLTVGVGAAAAGNMKQTVTKTISDVKRVKSSVNSKKRAINGVFSDMKQISSAAAQRTIAVSRQAAAYSIYLTVGVGAAAAGNMKQTVTKAISDVKWASADSFLLKTADDVAAWCRVPWWGMR